MLWRELEAYLPWETPPLIPNLTYGCSPWCTLEKSLVGQRRLLFTLSRNLAGASLPLEVWKQTTKVFVDWPIQCLTILATISDLLAHTTVALRFVGAIFDYLRARAIATPSESANRIFDSIFLIKLEEFLHCGLNVARLARTWFMLIDSIDTSLQSTS